MEIVRSHINEKFTEDSDPIRDLGIGYSFIHKLKPKTIFQSQKEFEVKQINFTEYSHTPIYRITHKNDGFGYIRIGWCGIISKVEKRKNILNIYCSGHGDLEDAKRFLKLSYGTQQIILKVTLDEFKTNFTIL